MYGNYIKEHFYTSQDIIIDTQDSYYADSITHVMPALNYNSSNMRKRLTTAWYGASVCGATAAVAKLRHKSVTGHYEDTGKRTVFWGTENNSFS